MGARLIRHIPLAKFCRNRLYDRFMLVVSTDFFRPRINKKKYGLACLCIWIFAFLTQINDFIGIDFSIEVFQIVKTFIHYVLESFLPFAIMLFLYHKIKKRLNAEENENSFALSDQSRRRNRKAVRTIRGLVLLFLLTVIPGRVFNILNLVLINYGSDSKSPFSMVLFVFMTILLPLYTLIFFMNNILNIFIYAKMIPGFRRFLLTVFSFGMYGKRIAID